MEYRKTKRGVLSVLHNWQKRYHVDKQLAPLSYSQSEFCDWAEQQEGYDALYANWEKHNFETCYRPHVGRFNYQKGYERDNIFLTCRKDYSNRDQVLRNQINRRGKPVRGLSLFTGEEMIFPNQGEAAAYFNSPKGGSNISRCARGLIQSAYGWKWEYI